MSFNRMFVTAMMAVTALQASSETLYSSYLNEFALFGLPASAELCDRHLRIDNTTDTPVFIVDTLTHDRSASFRFVARFANLHNSEGKSYKYFDSGSQKTRKVQDTAWGVVWNYVDSLNFCELSLQCSNSNLHDILDERTMTATIARTSAGKRSVLKQLSLRKDIDLYEGENTVHIVLDNSATTILLGNNRLSTLATLHEMPLVAGSRFGMMAGVGSKLSIERMVIQSTHSPVDDLVTEWSADSLTAHFAQSSDAVEGFWEYFDRSLDETALRLGGRYRLALVRTADGYDIIYIDGAEVDNRLWRPGMLKGRLSPTRFTAHYDLLWYDTEKLPFTTDIHASIDGNGIITLHFPLYNSQLRFVKSIDKQK